MKIVITGGHGQLGTCIMTYVKQFKPQDEYIPLGSSELDITDGDSVESVLNEINPDVIINCAAYTNVDKAETIKGSEDAKEINIDGPINLARYCQKYGKFLIHISTDFVFNGSKDKPYNEEDVPIPLNTYGITKFLGENSIRGTMNGNYLIFRTSWLYSEFGNNFVKKIAKRVDNSEPSQVVCDQIGCPTYAMDLAQFLVVICEYREYEDKCGIYHFVNKGYTTWYDLAKRVEILRREKDEGLVTPWFTWQCGAVAERPSYSVLSTEKTELDFVFRIPYWSDSLEKCISKIQ